MVYSTDANQAEIIEALRMAGATVHDIARVGHGCADLLVGFGGRNYLLEVKGPNGKLRPVQHRWHAAWKGHVAVVRTINDALRAIGLCVEGD